MPTYEYECSKCGHRFELFQPITADPVEKCVKCSGKSKRLIGAGAGIIFKGSGFYVTDYKNSGSVGGGSNGNGSSGSDKKSDEPKSESSSKKDVKTA